MGKNDRKKQSKIESEDMEEDEECPNITEEQIKEHLAKLMDPNAADNFVNKLPPAVRDRVRALQGIQKKFNEVHEKYLQDHKALEMKYEALSQPLFEKRRDIVNGKTEPEDAEVTRGIPEIYKESAQTNKENSGEKGIPDFWLTAFKNNTHIGEMIQERDEECLKHLTNVTAKNFPDPDTGFTLEFHFSSNEFFTNQLLTKTYHLIDEDEIVLDKAEGCTIDWLPNKNLTVVIKKKKQKSKGNKNPKVVTSEEPCESFFNFFKPPQFPENNEEDEDDEEEDIEEMIEMDYELGQIIKDKIIPYAIQYYTGEAESDDEDDDDFDEEDDEEGEEEDEEEVKPKSKSKKDVKSSPPHGPQHGGKPKKGGGDAGGAPPQQQECKQQ